MDRKSIKKEMDFKRIIIESEHLPTMPVVAQRLLSISEWDNVDLNAVADIISKDVSLSYKVLRVVNSPLYGFAQSVDTISHALVLLGLKSTRSLALSFCLPKLSGDARKVSFDYQGFWTRSLNTAVAARELALLSGLRTGEESFLTGLLQDIGVMVIAQCVPEAYMPLLRMDSCKFAPSVEMEREYLGTDHVEIANVLFEKWDLPASLCMSVLYHHAPEKAPHADHKTLLSIRIQHLAGCIGEWLYESDYKNAPLARLRDIASRDLNISSRELEELMYRVDRNMAEISGFFELNTARPTTYANLIENMNPALEAIGGE